MKHNIILILLIILAMLLCLGIGYEWNERTNSKAMFVEICGEIHRAEDIRVAKPLMNNLHIWHDGYCGYENGQKTQRIIYRNVPAGEQVRVFKILGELRR